MTGRWRHPAGRRPEGGAAVLEFLVVVAGFLVPLLFVLVTMDLVQRAMLGTSSAAREAGRVYLTASADHARDRAELAAWEILANHGLRDPARLSVELQGGCEDHGGCGSGHGPGSEVEVTVTYRVPVAGRLQGILPAELPVRSVHLTRGP
jgi:hypothetical protein